MWREGEVVATAGEDPETSDGDRDSNRGSGASHDTINARSPGRQTHEGPNYATSTAVFAETWDGKTAKSGACATGLTVNVGDVIEFDEGHIDPIRPVPVHSELGRQQALNIEKELR